MSDSSDFNQRVIAEYRATGGKLSGEMFATMPVLLLTTTGAKSGQPRTTPVTYLRDGDRILIFASNARGVTNPAWYHNLVAHPDVTVELGGERFAARATVAEGAERERLFAESAERMPALLATQQRVGRQIPVIILERR